MLFVAEWVCLVAVWRGSVLGVLGEGDGSSLDIFGHKWRLGLD